MLQSIRSVIKSGDMVRRSLRCGFILNLSLLILVFSIRAANPCGTVFQSLFWPRQLSEANRAAPQRRIDAPVLEAGKPIEREIAGGEAHSYQLTLTAGQYARVVVDQRGIDVVVTVYSPN